MILKRITLNNFLSHRNTTVEFPLGVTVFVGPNGAGKTSIIDGIFVALFNHRPRGENWSDVIHRGSASARIELDFEGGGVPYRVVWERRKTGTPVYKLYRADSRTLIAEGVREVQAQLEAITDLDRDSAINSILIRQGEITSLLDKTPAERKKIIGRLIGLDKLETAWKNMEGVTKHFKDKIRAYERLQGEYDYLTKQLEELELERQKLEAEIQELTKQIKANEEELTKDNQLLKTIEEKKEKHTTISNEIERINIQLEGVRDNLNKAIGELEQAEAAKKRMGELFPIIQKLELLEELLKITGEIKQLEERKSVFTSELSRIQEIESAINETTPSHEEYLKTESEIRTIEEKIAKLQSSREVLARLEKEKESVLKELDNTNNKLHETLKRLKECPLLPDRVDESLLSKLPEELEKEITELQANLNAYASRLEELYAEIKEVRVAKARMEELQPLVTRLPMLKELKALNLEISEKTREIERVQGILSSIAELRETLETLYPTYEEYQQIEKELERLQEELNKIQDELQQLSRLETKLHEKEAQLHKVKEEVEELEHEILKFLSSPTQDAKEKKLEELTKKIKETKEELKKQQDRIAALVGRINEIKEYLHLLEGSNICPVCHREMDEEHKARVRREFLEEITQNENEINRLESMSENLQKKLEELETLRRSIERLDVDRYQRMKQELEELITEVSSLKTQVAERNRLERMFIDIQREINKKEERKKSIEKDYHRYFMVQEQLGKILRENPELELQEQLSKLETQISQLQNRASQLASTLGEVPHDLDVEIETLEKLNEEYLGLRAKVERLESIETEITEIKNEIERITKLKIPSRLLAEKMFLERKIKELSEKLKDLEIKIGSTQRDVEHLKDLDGRRQELKAKLEELKPAHEKYVGSIEALKRERPKNEVLRNIDPVSQQLSSLESKKRELVLTIGEVPEDLEAEISRLRKLKEEYIRTSEEAKRVGPLQEQVSRLKAEVESLKRTINSKKMELESLGFSEEELRSLQEKVRNIENEIKKLEGKKAVRESNLEEKIKKIEGIKAQIETLKRELKKVEQLQKLVSDLEKIRAAYHRDSVQRLLRQKIAPIISELATEYIETFNMDITDVYLSEDFDITVVKNSTEVSTSTLSGGEKVAVALALRLAIARALSRNLLVVIMDEPTTHLDDERRKDLVEILDRFFKSSGAIPQVVIVTHHPELETVADTLYIVKNADGVSQAKEAESVEEGL